MLALFIFQAANIPYAEWEGKLASFMTNIVHAAKAQSAKLAIVDNIYDYGRSPGKKVDEGSSVRKQKKRAGCYFRW